METEKIIDRVHRYLDYKGIAPTNFEKRIGLSNGYLGTQKKRNADIGESILIKIIDNSLDIDANWLLTGKGSMLRGAEVAQAAAVEGVIYESELKDEIIALQKRYIGMLEAKICEYESAAKPVPATEKLKTKKAS